MRRDLEENPEEYVCTINFFKGKKLKKIPSGALHWIAANGPEPLATYADKVWQWREKFNQHFEEEF